MLAKEKDGIMEYWSNKMWRRNPSLHFFSIPVLRGGMLQEWNGGKNPITPILHHSSIPVFRALKCHSTKFKISFVIWISNFDMYCIGHLDSN